MPARSGSSSTTRMRAPCAVTGLPSALRAPVRAPRSGRGPSRRPPRERQQDAGAQPAQGRGGELEAAALRLEDLAAQREAEACAAEPAAARRVDAIEALAQARQGGGGNARRRVVEIDAQHAAGR